MPPTPAPAPINDRHIRVAALIQEIVAKYVQQEANTNPLITITSVTIAPDYRRATVFFTTIPDDRESDAQIFLKRSAGDIRHHLMKKCNLKIIPHLEFMLDVGERHRQHIDELANRIKEEDEERTDTTL
jgi:ribosome-binding factor A